MRSKFTPPPEMRADFDAVIAHAKERRTALGTLTNACCVRTRKGGFVIPEHLASDWRCGVMRVFSEGLPLATSAGHALRLMRLGSAGLTDALHHELLMIGLLSSKYAATGLKTTAPSGSA